MAGKYEQPKRAPKGKTAGIVILAAVLVLTIIGIVAVLWRMNPKEQLVQYLGASTPANPNRSHKSQTQSGTEAAAAGDGQEAPFKVSTVTIGATGDLMLHDLVLQSGYDDQSDTYNFNDIFTYFSKYVSKQDYSALNLEVTLAGEDNGYPYAGYPSFNSPDAILDAIKASGFDLLLTANNHAYDTGVKGFMRTQQVIEERELDHIGTKLDKADKNYMVCQINDIKIGMICYTYCSAYTNGGNYVLNGAALLPETTNRINAFHYKDLDTFYIRLSGEIEKMKHEGAEAIVVFMHWGTEYETVPDASQRRIAQWLCDMGVNVIVGTHPHVVQPIELLTSKTYPDHKTLCLYSVGKCLSNIYGNGKYPEHTEDGILAAFTFDKYSDGTVLLESADVLPIWLHRYEDDGTQKYQILPLETGADWKTQMSLSDEVLESCQKSYDRTMKIVAEGLESANSWFAQCQAKKESASISDETNEK